MDTFNKIFEEIKQDPMNQAFTQANIDPLYSVSKEVRLLIIGQAPGIRAQETRLFWNDPSGDRLRDWLNISRATFYDSKEIGVLPMDFYYPGKGKSGDLPPRKEFAAKWHPRLLALMPKIELILLVGSYATHTYLDLKSTVKLTDIVRNYEHYLPTYFPIIHPSPRNQIWMKKNPWFEIEVIPILQKETARILS
ncbi:uracil-DNA glycosylase family protein [Vagococcus silagei]|uniref:Uracil-DNA glycosylase family protein n=1 Tax=Vagococcus silagei TaxID=2508885 RepID=A0A4V3TV28_9ENTE|nr:uracil-DNA glycosylase family protein [Vagococcus silagei]THB61289.1 uracil-DNA glycosylase family protein [Vagococcus silagei]